MLHFDTANIALFQRPTAHSDTTAEICLTVSLNDIKHGLYPSVTYSRYHAHSDWVKQVAYLPTLDCFMSCSTSWRDSLVLGWMEKHVAVSQILRRSEKRPEARKIQKIVCFQIAQGINMFHHSPQYNLIATAGINHKVCLWNPYVKSKPSGILQGHMSSVLLVHFWSSRSLLFSLSKDKVLRAWDIQLQVCVQRLAGIFPRVSDVNIGLFLDEITDHKDIINSNNNSSSNNSNNTTNSNKNNNSNNSNSSNSSGNSSSIGSTRECSRLFLTFGTMLTVMETKNEGPQRVTSHDNMVVSMSQDGSLTFWMLDSGQKVKEMSNIHDNAEMLCMTVDEDTSMLYTGSNDGTVKVWDSNGVCHHRLVCGSGGEQVEVGEICVWRGSVVAVGWQRSVAIFHDIEIKDFIVTPSSWEGEKGHDDDILCAVHSPPNTLITGAYNGEIIVWNTKTELPIGQLRHRCRPLDSLSFGSDTKGSASSSTKSHGSGRKSGSSRIRSRMSSANSGEFGEDQNEFSWAVVNIHLMEGRKPLTDNPGIADLISCDGHGWVRLWNSRHCVLVGEFVAHSQSGSITMTVGELDTYLVTGDIHGWLKVWDISDYCINPTLSVGDIPPRKDYQEIRIRKRRRRQPQRLASGLLTWEKAGPYSLQTWFELQMGTNTGVDYNGM
ncbi:WD repeat-containing protein on Y chromosome-like [Argonauta hians]